MYLIGDISWADSKCIAQVVSQLNHTYENWPTFELENGFSLSANLSEGILDTKGCRGLALLRFQ